MVQTYTIFKYFQVVDVTVYDVAIFIMHSII